jgi:DNA processing protein
MPTAFDTETRALLLLARACLATTGVALWQVSAAVQRVGSARAVLAGDFEPTTHWELEVRSAVRGFERELGDAEKQLDEELLEWEDEGLRVTTVLDGDYPLNLRWVWDRPPFLFYRGELRQLDDAYALAVVGTRQPSDAGRRRARRMARLLAERGVTVLSGLAAGIDTEAHEATMEAGGRTVAVLGHGFGRPVYPKENEALAEDIAKRGALVSIFFPGTPPTRKTFPMRNVVTSGMGQGTVVIQASETSGARLQARAAATRHNG